MRSDLIKKGPTRAPHRSLLKAMGITESEMKRPFVAVVSAKSDYIPGHKHLDEIAENVKAGIRNAGGVPFEFNTIGVCDGIAMNHKGMKYSLCSRELIADSIEIMLTAHPLDAVVFIPNCDKIVPGMLIAACRLNLPSIFVSGGPMLPGEKDGERYGLSEMFEYVGACASGKITEEELTEYEDKLGLVAKLMKSRHAIAEIDGIIDSLTASIEDKEAAAKLQEVKGIINKLEE